MGSKHALPPAQEKQDDFVPPMSHETVDIMR